MQFISYFRRKKAISVQLSASRCNSVHHGANKNSVKQQKSVWWHLVQYRSYYKRNKAISVHHGASRCITVQLGASRCISVHHGANKNSVKQQKSVQWHSVQFRRYYRRKKAILVHNGASWCITVQIVTK